jgi:hypothetical protein
VVDVREQRPPATRHMHSLKLIPERQLCQPVYSATQGDAAQSRRRCGSGEPSPGADVAAVSRVPAQMWQR